VISKSAAERIAKLIPLLASDNDGEALAATRAIGRALESTGFDFHALAASVLHMRVVSDVGGAGGGDVTPRPSAAASWNYANAFREAEPVGHRHADPDASTRKFGLPVYLEQRIESWPEVCRHCLKLNRTILKKHGGRFLRDFEIKILSDIAAGERWPTNANASWIETVVARCHQARAKAAL
jgi:hypothetical protein